jgi:PKD domain-containing protein
VRVVRVTLLACLVAGTAVAGQAQAHALRGLIRDLPGRSNWAHGTPRRHAAGMPAPRALVAADQPYAYTANLPYGGGPVLHANRTHLIFWQPQGSGLTFDPGYQSLIEDFLVNVAADSRSLTSVYGLTGQYRDRGGPAAYISTYGGALLDTDRLPANGCAEPPVIGPGWSVCMTDEQLQHEIEHVVRTDRLPTGPTDVYFLVTPSGLGDCASASSTSCALGGGQNGYCGYHSQTDDGLVLYAVIPYNAVPGHCQSDNPRPNGNTADPAISTISHEHSEMVTDPVGNAWVDSSGNEVGDLCLTSFGPTIGGSGATAWNGEIHGGRYYLQEEWSNYNGSCEPRPKPDSLSFTAAVPTSRLSWLFFLARARDPEGSILTYHWFFGDGRTGSGRVASHRYSRPGSYRVVLRTTDSWGNWAFYASKLAVPR